MASPLRPRISVVPIRYKFVGAALVSVIIIGLAAWYLPGHTVAVFQPAGHIASREYRLIVITLALSLIVVIPVFVLLFGFAWKYRESNTSAKYSPDMAGNRWAETVWWLLPIVLIGVLSVITWQGTHELDPSKVLVSSTKPLTIQVVALQWKWLFIYPEQHIASVNFMQLPVNTPLNFEITADAPMNSFWIPQLGGQIYAMSGMSMPLHLIANKAGDYRGVSANISGKGFADMHFTARASDDANFADWVRSVRQSPSELDIASYNDLAKPNDALIKSYAATQNNLYDAIVMKYMMPGMTTNHDELAAGSTLLTTTGSYN